MSSLLEQFGKNSSLTIRAKARQTLLQFKHHSMARLVPWSSWDEWLMVKHLLLASSGDMQVDRTARRRGIGHVDAWRLRGKVPLAIDATSSLLDALDEHGASGSSTSTSSSSEYGLRLKFALIIIKLVNGVSDSQQRGRVASSVAVLASVAGLPRVLVDIRHDASHKELPSLPMLQLGARQALEWLKESYWSSQLSQLLQTRRKIHETIALIVESCTVAASTTGSSLMRGEEDEEEEEEEGGGKDGQAHTGKEGKKYRKELVSVLRSLVPNSWVQYIVDSFLDPPSSAHSRDDQCEGGDGNKAIDGNAILPPDVGAKGKEREGFNAAMKLIVKSYPSIGSLITSTAVRRLTQAGPVWNQSVWPSHDQSEGRDRDIDRWIAWLVYSLDLACVPTSDDDQELTTVVHVLLDPLISDCHYDQSHEAAEGCARALTSVKKLLEGHRSNNHGLLIALIDSALTSWSSIRSHAKDKQDEQGAASSKKESSGRWGWVEEETWSSCPIGRFSDPLSHHGRPCILSSSHQRVAEETNATAPPHSFPSSPPPRLVNEVVSSAVADEDGAEPKTKQKQTVGLKRKSAQLLL